jgi:hypothetical protein
VLWCQNQNSLKWYWPQFLRIMEVIMWQHHILETSHLTRPPVKPQCCIHIAIALHRTINEGKKS